MHGVGYMGSALGWALREGGARVVTALAGRSARSHDLAAVGGLEVLGSLDEVLAVSDVLLLVTPSDQAAPAAERVAATARRTNARPLVADLNAVSPATLSRIAETFASVGLPFVDGAISGPPPNVWPGARVYLSGEEAWRVARLPWRHVQPLVLDGPAGQASALKMCTGSVYNGVHALVTQAIRAADHYGVLAELLADLSGGLGEASPGAVAVAGAKAGRFIAEMQEIADAQESAGLSPELFRAFADVWREIAQTDLATNSPERADRSISAGELAHRLRLSVPAR